MRDLWRHGPDAWCSQNLSRGLLRLLTREVELLVIDRGPGTRDPRRRIPEELVGNEREELREEDIALSVASGFIKLLEGELRFEDTPGWGLTVVVGLHRVTSSRRTDHTW